LAGLIITGGLGLVAITTFLQGFVQGRSGWRHRLDKERALDEFDISNPLQRFWASLFHVISAYNNAGFGLWEQNLVGYRDNPVVNGVIASMIVIGGIGWRVINDLWVNRKRLRRVQREPAGLARVGGG
jgi:Trk-type K+ transport system membrane component